MIANIQLIRKGWRTAYAKNEAVSIWVRGQAHLGNEHFGTKALAERFATVALEGSVEGLDELVSSLNGTWAVVVKCGEWVYLATDHLRSIQILYRVDGDALYVFDDMEDFRKTHKLVFDEDCVQEYLSSGYVYGNRTLYKETYSLQAAERVWVGERSCVDGGGKNSRVEHVERVEGGKWKVSSTALRKIEKRLGQVVVESWRYWRYVPNINKPVATDGALVERIDNTFLAAMRRLVESVGNKRIIVPLSGGYDSRLIVNYLYLLGVKNVLCYTYGVKGNGESRCSKEVASRLGYEWHFVEYTNENRTVLLNDVKADACFRYMCNGTNRYCNQEHIAIQALKDSDVLNSEMDVIVPGYYFDFLAGSKVNPRANNLFAASEMCQWENNFYPKGHFRKSIKAIQSVFDEHDDLSPKVFYEGWAWQERLAKFIVNNVRDYEWLGFEWRLPLCDRDLYDLWLSLPYSLRRGRHYFYRIFPKIAVEEIRAIGFNNHGKQSFVRKAKQSIGEMIPYSLRFRLDRLLNRKIRYGGGTLASTQLDVRQLADSIVEMFPFCKERLSDLSNVSPNAAMSLRGLVSEAGVKL